MLDTTFRERTTTEARVKKVFLSYSREDAALVPPLKGTLERLGCTVWLDENLSGGQTWWNEILKQIQACDLYVIAVTEHSAGSKACIAEFEYARDVQRHLLPVLLSDVSTNLLPKDVAEIHLVDFRKDDRDAALDLARALTDFTQRGARALPDPLPSSPPVPTSYLENLARLARQDGLSSEQQSRLLVELKASLQNPKLAGDARTVLEQMRSRPDVLASIDKEVADALATYDRVSTRPGPAPTKGRSLQTILQRVVGVGIGAAIGVFVLYGVLFSPRIDVQATDVDWEPRNPQVGQRVTVTGRYVISYGVRTGLSWSRQLVRGEKLNDIFTATWSVDGSETNREEPRTATTGDVLDTAFETAFERPGPHEIAFAVRSTKSDAESSKKKIVRTVYVQTSPQ